MNGVIWVCDSCGTQCKTDEEKEQHQRETNSHIVTFTPIPEPPINEIWLCASCGTQCKSDDEKKDHEKKTNHKTYAHLPDNPEIISLVREIGQIAEDFEKKMRSLSEYNEEKKRQRLWDKEHAHLAGVLCDTCNTELHYSEPHAVIDSDPPGRWVFCPNKDCSNFKERKTKTV